MVEIFFIHAERDGMIIYIDETRYAVITLRHTFRNSLFLNFAETSNLWMKSLMKFVEILTMLYII